MRGNAPPQETFRHLHREHPGGTSPITFGNSKIRQTRPEIWGPSTKTEDHLSGFYEANFKV
jgi:hypothetical protein